jgi:hypothetical protein
MESATRLIAETSRIDRVFISHPRFKKAGSALSPQLVNRFRLPEFRCSSKQIPCFGPEGSGRHEPGKALESWLGLDELSSVSMHFPVFTLLNRDPPPETSSPQTPSTATESSRAETFRYEPEAIRKIPRVRGVLGDIERGAVRVRLRRTFTFGSQRYSPMGFESPKGRFVPICAHPDQVQ